MTHGPKPEVFFGTLIHGPEAEILFGTVTHVPEAEAPWDCDSCSQS